MRPTGDQRNEQDHCLRVLELCGSAAGGVRSHLAQCARILAAAGHDVIVEAPAAVLAGSDLGGARAEVLEIGPRPAPSDSGAVARLRRLGRSADVVHAHGLRAGAQAALALGRRSPGRTRLVVTVHNLPVGGRLTTAVGRRLEALVASRADAVLAVSPDLSERLLARGATEVDIAVIPAPEPRDGPTAPPASSVDSAWGAARPRLLTVARLAPQKGLDLLLETAAVLAGTAQGGGLPGAEDLSWAVAGDGPGLPAARSRIAEGRLPVTLLGRREDVPALLRATDVVVQTSLWEGQPLAIQEAMRAGAAIVATDVGGTAVTARGAALLVTPDPHELAAAIGGLLTDPSALEAARRRSRVAAAGLPTAEDLAAQLDAVLVRPVLGAGGGGVADATVV
ncbi:MAG: glycosyltransferase family 4 protein [Actinomyces sp.]|uniref:glycosyltransferase family 4 protein n=1 Tax=Actinomyces sp. TaxID=29317 RepID=UPI0026DBFA95|nr:glycosyltransferase family 4 protein [Actinomyces sp.]MDO4244173.1 glycosyltransferase family 4 protein [Actinomyces sp.]